MILSRNRSSVYSFVTKNALITLLFFAMVSNGLFGAVGEISFFLEKRIEFH